MIYTVTFNPAIDYVVHVDGLTPGMVNRTSSEGMYFGGKGINVSAVLKELGVESVALGFIAGFTGDAIEKGVSEMGVRTDFIRLKSGNSRINVKIKAGDETEINCQGPDIDGSALEALYWQLDRLVDGDTLILAGSVPKSLPPDIYESIMRRLSGRNIRFVVDAAKDLLLNVLKYKPFFVKPNNHELGEIFGVTIAASDDAAHYAAELQKMGARNVLVSMAGDGAILLDESGKTHFCAACKGTVKNSVGAGDSMVAGFIAGIAGGDYGYALRLGTAAGGATAFSDGLADRDMIHKLMKQLTE